MTRVSSGSESKEKSEREVKTLDTVKGVFEMPMKTPKVKIGAKMRVNQASILSVEVLSHREVLLTKGHIPNKKRAELLGNVQLVNAQTMDESHERVLKPQHLDTFDRSEHA